MHHRRPNTDSDPVAAAARGDRRAWAQLVDRHGGQIYDLCRRLSPDPDDCCQEIWVRVHARLSTYDPAIAPFRSWLMTIAHRHLIDRHRRRRRRSEVILPELVSAGSDPERAAMDQQRTGSLHDAIASLPPGQQRVVVLHHLHGLSLAQIADDEGIALGTVKSRLHRARAALARTLAAGEHP